MCVCVFFFFRKRLPRNFIGLIRPVSLPRCTSIEPRLRKERLARVSICLHNKRGFDHVESERTFYTYIQSIAICFKFDPLLHSSRLDITPFLSLYLTLPCPESWLPPPPSLQQYTHIYTHNKYSWGSPVFQIHGLLIYVQPLYKTCVKGKKRIKFLWHLKMSIVCPVDF